MYAGSVGASAVLTVHGRQVPTLASLLGSVPGSQTYCVAQVHRTANGHGAQRNSMSLFGRARKFGSGVVASLAGASVVYLVADSANDIITLRKCQHQVLDLAVKHSGLCQELGVPIEVGSLLKSSVRFSPSGRLVKCQFAVDGATKSSDVSATLHRPVYPSSILYNLSGPGDWELLNCHILVGGSDTLVRSVNLLTNEQEGPRSPPKPLPAHLFKEMQRFHAQAPPDVAPSGPDATPPPDTRAQ